MIIEQTAGKPRLTRRPNDRALEPGMNGRSGLIATMVSWVSEACDSSKQTTRRILVPETAAC